MEKKHAFLMSLEGIEGTGKSTQSEILRDYLKDKGLKVALFREPGSSVIGEKIREILLYGKGKMTSYCETMLFIAARAQLIEEKIRKNLFSKDVIILDRYIDATIAYQGYGENVNIKLIEQLNKFAVGDLVPQLTILFDIAPKTGLMRSGRNDRYEKRKLDFHNKVRKGYLEIAGKNSERIKIIPVKGDIQQVHKYVIDIFYKAFNDRKKR